VIEVEAREARTRARGCRAAARSVARPQRGRRRSAPPSANGCRAREVGLPENIYQYGYWGSIASVLIDPTMCGKNLPTLTGTEMPTAVHGHCPKYQALAEQVP
jgi:hypothetical protein